MTGREKRLLKNKLGTLEPQHPVPDGYQNWLSFLKANKNPPEPYKSWLEFRLFELGSLKGVDYEPGAFPYTQEIKKNRKYTPDGVRGDLWIEVKGRFRTRDEAEKYISIRESNPDKKLIFVFAKKGVKMPGARRRRDGSFFTLEEWCEREGFEYYHEGDNLEKVL